MNILLEFRLQEAAKRAALRLRGFGDPEIHTGSPESFYFQFRRVLAMPSIHAGDGGLLSYAEAVVFGRVEDGAATGELVDELTELIGGPEVNDAGTRVVLARASVAQDIQAMLAVPAMRFYIRAEQSVAFADGVRALAQRVAHPVEIGLNRLDERPVEQFRVMGIGPNISCRISYDMLRLITEEVPISAYQAEDYVSAAGEESAQGR